MSQINYIITWSIAGFTGFCLSLTVFIEFVNRGRTKKIVGVKTLHDLRKEYDEDDFMQTSVNELRLLYENICNKVKDKVVAEYDHIVKSQRQNTGGESSLFESRKKVSHFYQRLATFYSEKVIYSRILYSSWYWSHLELVEQCIIPIEESIEGHSKTAINKLKKLCKDLDKYRDC